ncbi:MAG: hypothetical protein ACHBN1_28030 [Heteroscytonema crispum UTEX LB 1556]
MLSQPLTTDHYPLSTNHQPRRGSPVAWVGKTPLAPLGETPRPQWLPYQGRPFTTNPTGEPVLGVLPSRSTGSPPTTNPGGVHQSPGSGKRHLLHLGRPQDRSGSPTKGAPSPPTLFLFHSLIFGIFISKSGGIFKMF